MNEESRSELDRSRESMDRKKTAVSNDENPQFVLFEHPKNFFSIDYPAHWVVMSDTDDSVEFQHPDPDSGVGLMIFRTPLQFDTEELKQSEQWQLVAKAMLETVGSIDLRPDPTILYSNFTGNRTEPDQAGQRWIVIVADLVLCISSSVPIHQSEIWQPLIERLLSSLRVDRDDEVLALRVLAYAQLKIKQSFPDHAVTIDGLTLKTQHMEISLKNLIPQVKRNPQSLESIVDQFIGGVLQMSAPDTSLGNESWDQAKHRIQPMLKSDKYVQDVNQITMNSEVPNKTGSMLISLPWLADLRICFAIDDEKTFRFVNDLDLQRWSVSIDELARISIENLKRYPDPELHVMALNDETPKLGELIPKGGAAASYILHPNLFRWVQPKLGQAIFAAIPSRDSILLFEDRGQHEAIQRAVQRDFRSTNHPVSDRLFRVTPDGIALL